MEHAEPVPPQAPVPAEAAVSKGDAGSQTAQSTTSHALPSMPLDSGVDNSSSGDLPHQNGVGPSAASTSSLLGQDAAPVPAPSEVPAISAIIDDPQAVPGEPLPVQPLPVSHVLNDPAVQAETSTLRSLPQPSAAAASHEVSQESAPAPPSAAPVSDILGSDPAAEASSAVSPTSHNLSTTQTTNDASAETKADEKEVSPRTGELSHRSPADSSEVPMSSSAFNEASQPPQKASVPAVPSSPLMAAASEHDHVMTDAPASPSKLARSREDGDEDEPATKRLKADEGADETGDLKMEDAPPVSAPASEPPATSDVSGAVQTQSVPPYTGDDPQGAASASPAGRVFSSDFDKPVTAAQKKVLQRIILNIKRGPHSMAFKEPVDPVALNIPTYFDVVKNPMDLSTMESKAKNSDYSNVNEFLTDFDQIVTNSELFNGVAHPVTTKAYDMRRSFDKQIVQIPSAEFVEPPPPDKKGARRVSTDAQKPQRRESRSSVGNAKSPTAASPASPAFALQPSGIPVIRRDSNAGDGRPRREIHPPAPKDLPYSASKPKKKKYQWELKFCQEIVNEFKKPKYQASSWPFLTPVDPVAMNIPTYHKIIKKPMDLGTMEQKLKTGQYENAKEFEADMRQIFWNCFKFNVSGDTVFKAGESLEKLFDDKWESKKQWIKDHAPSSSVVSPESSAEGSDDDDDDEDDDDEEEEENRKRNQVRMSEIETQISMLNKELLDLRKANEAPPKKKQRSKGSGSKSKDSRKKSKGEKKSSGGSKTKKAKELPYVTYEQKQAISERINSLPPERMNAALNIIRSNMPGLKGEDEEIELDIDELSNEVLHKLLNFVKKYAPRSEDQVEAKREKPAASTKPKKNKPMGKVEQEARIKELREKLQGAASDDSDGADGADDSSGDDDSEESEED